MDKNIRITMSWDDFFANDRFHLMERIESRLIRWLTKSDWRERRSTISYSKAKSWATHYGVEIEWSKRPD